VVRLAQEYFGVRGALGDRLFQLVAKDGGEEDGVTFEGLIICKVGTLVLPLTHSLKFVPFFFGRIRWS
jgi:hypothetical protein